MSRADTLELRIDSVAPRIECVTFPSRALKRDQRFCVVLPNDYSRDTDGWPVLYLLHGRGRTHRSLIDDEACLQQLLQANFVVILPEGNDGWYIDSPVRPADRYASYLTDVIDTAGKEYRLSSDPGRRALCGWSMGGYGCARYAVTHSGEFGTIATILGLLDFPREGFPEGQSYRIPLDRFGSDGEVWPSFNPIHEAEKLADSSVLLVTADRAFDRTMNENFHARLNELKIAHEWVVLPGGHEFGVVREALPLVMRHVSAAFQGLGDKIPRVTPK